MGHGTRLYGVVMDNSIEFRVPPLSELGLINPLPY